MVYKINKKTLKPESISGKIIFYSTLGITLSFLIAISVGYTLGKKDRLNLSEEETIKILPFIPPGKLRHKIITDCHDSPASGHYGTEKTYRRARKSFYWKGMREEIRLYCSRIIY
jgi:hypothetical protein